MISHAVRIFFEKKKFCRGSLPFLAHFGSFWLIIAILNALNTLKNGKNGSFFEIHHFFWKQNRFLGFFFFWVQFPPRPFPSRIGVYTENAITSSIFIFTLTNTLSFNQNFIL